MFVYVVWLYLGGHGGFTGHVPSREDIQVYIVIPLNTIISLSEVSEGMHCGPMQNQSWRHMQLISLTPCMHEIVFKILDVNLS